MWGFHSTRLILAQEFNARPNQARLSLEICKCCREILVQITFCLIRSDSFGFSQAGTPMHKSTRGGKETPPRSTQNVNSLTFERAPFFSRQDMDASRTRDDDCSTPLWRAGCHFLHFFAPLLLVAVVSSFLSFNGHCFFFFFRLIARLNLN